MQSKNVKYIFWGVGPLAENALYFLYENGIAPSLVITTPDTKSGRHLEKKENPLVIWCKSKNIKFWQPESLKDLNIKETPLAEEIFDLALVVSYPKILKDEILNLPKMGTLNIHPSYLPTYRGPSPIQTALLNNDKTTAVSIIKLDAEIDHGPILIQEEIEILDQDTNQTLEKKLAILGATLFIKTFQLYLVGSLELEEQKHAEASFSRKFEKKDGEIKLVDNAVTLRNKFRSLLPHIPIYFFINYKNKEMRVKITEIILNQESLQNLFAKDIIKKVIPEGKREMSWQDFERGYFEN